MKLPFPENELFDRAVNNFDQTARAVFQFQFAHNVIYNRFATSLGKTPDKVNNMRDIPFLPVEFFKSQNVYCGTDQPEIVFTSSGTTGVNASNHRVAKKKLYEESFLRGFELAYGSPKDFIFLFLLPSYLERDGSSLIYMAEVLKQKSASEDSNFYLHNYSDLTAKLKQLQTNSSGKRIMLFGVTYALLDLAEQFPQPLSDVIILETGGMKGKRKEITREELHTTLKNAFHVDAIHSEYGMTELLSQAWSKGEGIFHCPLWMKILTRETNDPLSWTSYGKTGGINIIDFANINSCSFISTSDLGKINTDGSFEILGRFDFSDTRGCNLLVE